MRDATLGRLLCLLALVAVLAAVLATGCRSASGHYTPGKTYVCDIEITAPDGSSGTTPVLFSIPADSIAAPPWPVVVALHGYGGNTARFHAIWQPPATAAGFVLITPQGEAPTAEGIGYGWGEQADEELSRSLNAVASLVSLDARRVHLVGFSQGGYIACVLALRHPQQFTAVALLGAPLQELPLARLDPPRVLPHLPVYIGHGELEPNLDQMRATIPRLEEFGLAVHFQVYPGIRHELPEPVEDELNRILAFFHEETTP